MRTFIISFLLLFSSIIYAQESVNFNQLDKRNDIYYIHNTNTPFTGKALKNYPNGKIGMAGTMVKGKFDGLWVWWYSNGQKKRETKYVKGLKQGKSFYWWDNGVKKLESLFVDDRSVSQKRWSKEGKLLPNPRMGGG